MKRIAILIACLIPAPAFAYDIKNLSQQDILIIGEALDAMPYAKVSSLYMKIQQQITAENQAAEQEARAKMEKDLKAKIESDKLKDNPKPRVGG